MTCRAQVSNKKDSGFTTPLLYPTRLQLPTCTRWHSSSYPATTRLPLQVSRLLWTHLALPAMHWALPQTLETLASFPTAWLWVFPAPNQSTGTIPTSPASSESLYSMFHSKTRNAKLGKSYQSRKETKEQEIQDLGFSNAISCINNRIFWFYIWKTHSWKTCSSESDLSSIGELFLKCF